jgi:hypothetical protein
VASWPPTARVSPPVSGGRLPTSIRFCEAPNRQICQLSSQRNSSSSLTSRLQRRSGLPFPNQMQLLADEVIE